MCYEVQFLYGGPMEIRKCKTCSKDKLLDEFHKTTTGYRGSCRVCYNQTVGAKANLKMKNRRKDPNRFAFFIVKDSKFADKKEGFESDLDESFVSHLIKNGCSYCGEKEIRLSVDRIDNSKGHTKDNVISSCVRCNFIRNDMPYEAWLILVPSVRLARESGLFENWTGGIHRNSKFP